MKICKNSDSGAIAAVLKSGGVVFLPTDTQYGLVCSIRSPKAVQRIFGVKERVGKPGTLIAASAEQLIELGINKKLVDQVALLWPAPLSVLFDMPEGYEYVHLGLGSNAIRVPDAPKLLDLLKQTGILVTTSANLPGEPPVETIKEATALFGDLVDLYVDAGELRGRAPSTVARLEQDGSFTVLRQGAFIDF